MGSDDQKRSPGLVISNSESIRSFLVLASRDSQLSPELQEVAFNLSSLNNLPYKSIRNIWVASHPSTRADLIRLFSGSAFVFTSPKPREKSEELVARLRKLALRAERNEYQELVKDITPNNDASEPFSSYKDQLGFELREAGRLSNTPALYMFASFSRYPLLEEFELAALTFNCLHVVLIMFTGYLVGYATFRALFSHGPVMSAAGGILGLVCGMLVETLLFIIRSSRWDARSPSDASKLKKNQ
ncbi:hypothetical protein JRO89_XS03G0095700 [Xanthoceras sorbifolium]|uniref:Uncharacterized protein n=1 Tax=Xanthoceras sorbifolium TaxID=99658 RepID=A0ABQ8I9L6_9ROSI|nr:hypothetical protein JRO89_XS03G0095700 [Xanthoceras sorbifolium]